MDLKKRTDIAELYKVPIDDVKCSTCRFQNWGTWDLDSKTCYCVVWKQKMLLKSFCQHYSKGNNE